MRRTFLCHASAVRLCSARISSLFITPTVLSIVAARSSQACSDPDFFLSSGYIPLIAFFSCWLLNVKVSPLTDEKMPCLFPQWEEGGRWWAVRNRCFTPLTGFISAGQVGSSAHFRNLCFLLTVTLLSWDVHQGLGKWSKQLYWFLQIVLPFCAFKSTALCG